jgi:hypothetical protein
MPTKELRCTLKKALVSMAFQVNFSKGARLRLIAASGLLFAGLEFRA